MYRQITQMERYCIAKLIQHRWSIREIARLLRRSPSTISREIKRNRSTQGIYTVSKAQSKTNNRRRKSRKKPQFTKIQFGIVLSLIREKYYSPEQASNVLKKKGVLSISHETIYKYIWKNKKEGGIWYKSLRQSVKRRRKRYNSKDSRGRMSGKRQIEERPIGAINRSRIGHFEVDTVLGKGSKHCILTLVERKTGYLFIKKLKNRTTAEANKAMIEIIKQEQGKIKTITADNGTEFHQYKEVEKATGVKFFFAKPYHSWERGTNENTNGLIRQFIPKGKSMTRLTPERCLIIEKLINERPRKRYDYLTPQELYV